MHRIKVPTNLRYQRLVRQHCPDLVALDSKRFRLPDLDKEVQRIHEQTDLDVPDPQCRT